MTRKYPVIYEWGGRNFSGYSPDVPGCAATAKTLQRIRTELKGALESHLRWIQRDGDPIPEASSKTTVDMTEDAEFPNPPGYYVIVEQLDVTLPRKPRMATARKTPARRQAARELVAA